MKVQSVWSEIFVNPCHEYVARHLRDEPCSADIANDEYPDVDEEGQVWDNILQIKLSQWKVNRVQGNVYASTSTNNEGAPPPLVVLVAELHVSGDDRKEGDDD